MHRTWGQLEPAQPQGGSKIAQCAQASMITTWDSGEGRTYPMNELVIAVIGGLVVLAVQGTVVLARQWRRRINAGEVQASRAYVRLRRLAHLLRKRSTVKKLQLAASSQRASIERQYAQDPMWRLGQLRLVKELKDANDRAQRLTLAAALSADDAAKGIFVKGD